MSVFAILTALALAFFGAYAAAGSGVHVLAAIEHTREAIDDGAKGDSKEIVTHVMSALGHAREALHETPSNGTAPPTARRSLAAQFVLKRARATRRRARR